MTTLKQMITIIELTKKIPDEAKFARGVFCLGMSLIADARTDNESQRIHDTMFEMIKFEEWGIPRFLTTEG